VSLRDLIDQRAAARRRAGMWRDRDILPGADADVSAIEGGWPQPLSPEPTWQDGLRRHSGFDPGVGMSYEEVARVFGVTRERIRQIEQTAFRKLRRGERLCRLLELVES